ncbi:MAG TPA: hypothetical protein VKY85_08755 [Candidatus Angelobacter sp.]|nr:hypothetical protein [Candidatus Angelobacter sp.]
MTLAGEVTIVPSPGLEMVSGKAEDGGGGSCAGGAGKELVCGDHVGGTGVGVGLAEGVGEGVGVGEGEGVGAGPGPEGVGVGVGETVALDAPPAHPATKRLAAKREARNKIRRVNECEEKMFTAGSSTWEKRFIRACGLSFLN